MNEILSKLLRRLDSGELANTSVIPWGCPVISFGDVEISAIATLGLNPSNREFVDETGEELVGAARRFHTLRSLGIARWSDASERELQLIDDSCRTYFSRNPYDVWFRRLDRIIAGTNASYYGGRGRACHLDLIPYATACKWTELHHRERTALLAASGDTLGNIIRDSPINALILNGSSVVRSFEHIAGIRLRPQAMPAWALPRRAGPEVMGIAYVGAVRHLATVDLRREISVLGFNHNIQSSFGVTTEVIAKIRTWIARTTRRPLA